MYHSRRRRHIGAQKGRESTCKLVAFAAALTCAAAAAMALLARQQVAFADDRKTASEIVRARGFDVAEFDVVSSQNYPLKVYRIINPLANARELHRIPVVCGHGISLDFAFMFAGASKARPRRPSAHERVTLYEQEDGQDDRGLYFYLSNNNYDVWLIESRGSDKRVARRLFESNSSMNSNNFWDFSLDEQALIDLPTQIEFVRARTGAPKVAFIGYSQSTSLMFALLSMEPEFADKLASYIAIAPVAYTTHIKGIMLPFGLTRLVSIAVAQRSSLPNWMRRATNQALTYACSISFIKETLCRGLWQALSGPDKNAIIDKGLIENPIKQTAVRTFEQYFSNRNFHTFRMYDYKSDELNMQHYGQRVPPIYNVSNIRLRTMSLFRGTNDFLSDPADQMTLLSKLRVPLYEDHILDEYSHIDFLVSPTVVRDVNEPILRILDQTTGRQVYKVRHSISAPSGVVRGGGGGVVERPTDSPRQVNTSVAAAVAAVAARKNATANEFRRLVDNT